MRLFILFSCFTTWVAAQHNDAHQTGDKHDLLDTVLVRNRISNADTLLARVSRNYATNHNLSSYKFLFTHEDSNIIIPNTLKIDVDKVPGSKNDKQLLQQRVNTLVQELKQKPIKSYKKHKGVYAGVPQYAAFTDLKEAYKFNRYQDYTSVEQLMPMVKKALHDDIPFDQNYKIKSGVITINKNTNLIMDTARTRTAVVNGKEVQITRNLATNIGYDIHRLSAGNSVDYGKWQELLDTKAYTFSITDYVVDDVHAYYIVSFIPDARKSKYAGTIHIDAFDYGIHKLDYNYAPDEHGQKINVKWLLGVKFNEYACNQEIRFNKTDNATYYPTYVKYSKSSRAYIHRPVSFKDKSNNDKYTFDITIDGLNHQYEILTLTNAEIYEPAEKGIVTKGIKNYRVLD